MKIYTKTGDDGTTGLQGGRRISKSDLRIISYGTVDEINAVLGIVLSNKIDDDIRELIIKIQNELFVVGSDLSNPDLESTENRVSSDMVEFLEHKIDQFNENLDPLTNFILPGGDNLASFIHLARAVARRAETKVVALSEKEEINKNCEKYLNRLSDLLFVLARTINKRTNNVDVLWKSSKKDTL